MTRRRRRHLEYTLITVNTEYRNTAETENEHGEPSTSPFFPLNLSSLL
jgi:hypothetical protein